nr:hypothetical protein CTI12_AA390580 [Tanacetum cinerariifolium]
MKWKLYMFSKLARMTNMASSAETGSEKELGREYLEMGAESGKRAAKVARIGLEFTKIRLEPKIKPTPKDTANDDKEIGKSSGIDDEVVQDQRQRDDNDLQDERQDQPKEEEVEPQKCKKARTEKLFGSDFVSFIVEIEPTSYREAVTSSEWLNERIHSK